MKVNPTICICCGERMRAGGGALSRDPNVCASCSSLIDGLSESQRTSLERVVDAEIEAAEAGKEMVPELSAKNLTS